MKIKINNRESVLNAIVADLRAEKAFEYFITHNARLTFLERMLAQEPFGPVAAAHGFDGESIKHHKINAIEVFERYFELTSGITCKIFGKINAEFPGCADNKEKSIQALSGCVSADKLIDIYTNCIYPVI